MPHGKSAASVAITMDEASPVVPYGIQVAVLKSVTSQSTASPMGTQNHTVCSSHFWMRSFWHSKRPPTSAAAKKKPNECCVTHCREALRQLAGAARLVRCDRGGGEWY